MKKPEGNICCPDCYVPEHDAQRGHALVAVPDSCSNAACECHTSHSEARQEGGGWRERFDAKFAEQGTSYEDIKYFIERELKATEERARREVLEEVQAFLASDDMAIEEGIHTDGADITEAPPEMWAEITGVKKGWEAAKGQISEWLSRSKE